MNKRKIIDLVLKSEKYSDDDGWSTLNFSVDYDCLSHVNMTPITTTYKLELITAITSKYNSTVREEENLKHQAINAFYNTMYGEFYSDLKKLRHYMNYKNKDESITLLDEIISSVDLRG